MGIYQSSEGTIVANGPNNYRVKRVINMKDVEGKPGLDARAELSRHSTTMRREIDQFLSEVRVG
jgi:hypothetical protein